MIASRHRFIAIQALCLVAGALGLAAPRVMAVVYTSVKVADDQVFPKPLSVRKQVRFWEKIFYRYPSTTVVIHDTNDLDRIVDLIDFKLFARRENKEPLASRKARDDVTLRYLKRYAKALERFQKFGVKAVDFGAIEKRLFHVYRKNPQALRNLYKGKVKLRGQTGLADNFKEAVGVAQNYLPYMEKVFESYKLPKLLTRMAFVESMFNLKAVSKVGASGIWQFMPSTARHFIYVNQMVDERNDPFKATRAAAQLLSINYRELKAWPLAITAYNHGRTGMQRAVRAVGTKDFGQIIERYNSSSFGFASKNFYSEFLAAASTYERLIREHKIENVPPLADTETLVLQTEWSIKDLVKHTPLTVEILAEHNRCLRKEAFDKYGSKPLPKFYVIKIPRGMAQATKTALETHRGKSYARR